MFFEFLNGPQQMSISNGYPDINSKTLECQGRVKTQKTLILQGYLGCGLGHK